MTTANPSREELHRLLDRIPESDVPAARKFLRSLLDPVELALLNAPSDDELEPEEERAAVEVALADPAADVPFEQIQRLRK